jgi:hypothetical protein
MSSLVTTEWLLEPCFDREVQDFLMAELQDVMMTMVQRLRENTITRPDLLSVGASSGATSLTLDGKEVSILVQGFFRNERHAPAYIQVTVGSGEMIAKRRKAITAAINHCGGEVYTTKFSGPN